jgi:hypothetical protein
MSFGFGFRQGPVSIKIEPGMCSGVLYGGGFRHFFYSFPAACAPETRLPHQRRALMGQTIPLVSAPPGNSAEFQAHAE